MWHNVSHSVEKPMKQHMTMRLPPDLVDRIDAYSKAMADKTGLDVKCSDVIRLLLTAGLDLKEKEFRK